MDIEGYQYLIDNVLQNGDFGILQRQLSFYRELEKCAAVKVEAASACKSEYAKKRIENVNKISELQHQINALKFQIDEVKLQQKIVDKKVANVIKQEEKLQNDISDVKARRDSLSLELVDLKQEVQERRERKRKHWDAIKRATSIYKSSLNFGIKIEGNEYLKIIRILFFINDERTKDKYYVKLINADQSWRVEEIQPMLKKEHWIDLKGTIDFTNQSRVSNIRAFLCLLRIIFLKYYINTR